MNTFKEKEKGHEAKFAKEQELKFKFIARRNKLFALWAASQMNKNTEDSDEYAKEIISLYIDKPADQNILEKISNDLANNNIQISKEEINKKFEECFNTAKEQIISI